MSLATAETFSGVRVVDIQFAVAIVAIAGNRPERDPLQAVDLRARANRLAVIEASSGRPGRSHTSRWPSRTTSSRRRPPKGRLSPHAARSGVPTGPRGRIFFEAACGEIHQELRPDLPIHELRADAIRSPGLSARMSRP